LLFFCSTVSPICLWPTEENQVSVGKVITWTEMEADDPGYWNHFQDPLHNYPTEYDLPIRLSSDCFLIQPRFKSIASQRTFCAGGLNSGQCLEVGNSGASMSVQIGERFFMKGIVSASFIDIAGCDNVTFTLFTDVLKHKSWLIDSIKDS
jgi:Trypsin